MSCNSSDNRNSRQVLRRGLLFSLAGFFMLMAKIGSAESLQSFSNPVSQGAIQVANGNSDRSDWAKLPVYDEDGFDDATPNNYFSVQAANDSSSLYFRFVMEESEAYGSRHNLFLDTDQDRETGFIGTGAEGFLSAGADYLVQGGAVYRFSAAAQNDWGWDYLEDIRWDATPATDIEIAIRRVAIGNPVQFDFFLNAANFDLGQPEDFYPDTASLPNGDFYSYQMGSLAGVGIDELTSAIRAGSTEARFDLNRDGQVNTVDRTYWVEVLNKTYFGDANLDGLFNSSDLITVFQAGEYEDALPVNSRWATGDWNGDGEFNSSDFVTAFQGAGFELGPRAAVASVPEPSGIAGWLIAFAGLFRVTTKGFRRLK